MHEVVRVSYHRERSPTSCRFLLPQFHASLRQFYLCLNALSHLVSVPILRMSQQNLPTVNTVGTRMVERLVVAPPIPSPQQFALRSSSLFGSWWPVSLLSLYGFEVWTLCVCFQTITVVIHFVYTITLARFDKPVGDVSVLLAHNF